jgi:hypothetical protein
MFGAQKPTKQPAIPTFNVRPVEAKLSSEGTGHNHIGTAAEGDGIAKGPVGRALGRKILAGIAVQRDRATAA